MHLRDVLDISSKRRDWRWERAGWVLIALVIVAASAGAFGGGPLANETREADLAGGEVELEYERLNRLNHVSVLVLRVHAPEAIGDQLNLTFSRDMVEIATIRSSAPSAEGGAGPHGVLYGFPVDDWSAPITVSLEYVPERAGRHAPTATIDVGGDASVVLPLDQFVYP